MYVCKHWQSDIKNLDILAEKGPLIPA